MNSNKDQSKGFIIQLLEKNLDKGKLNQDQKNKILIWSDISLNILTIVVLVIILRTFIMSPFQVYGISMCNTLNYINNKCVDNYGDYIIINKSSYLNIGNLRIGKPERGDVIVFRPPQNHQEFFIKRVIGLPGERVELIDGYVYIFNKNNPQGIKLNETYLSSENQGSTFATGGIYKFTIPEGQYFVLGDNRQKSSDSRLCFQESPGSPGCGAKDITPFLDSNLIEGKAALVLWPQPRVIESHRYPELRN